MQRIHLSKEDEVPPSSTTVFNVYFVFIQLKASNSSLNDFPHTIQN
jgi:hypothetical protein